MLEKHMKNRTPKVFASFETTKQIINHVYEKKTLH